MATNFNTATTFDPDWQMGESTQTWTAGETYTAGTTVTTITDNNTGGYFTSPDWSTGTAFTWTLTDPTPPEPTRMEQFLKALAAARRAIYRV